MTENFNTKTGNKYDAVTLEQLKKMANLQDESQAIAGAKWATLVVVNYCMDQEDAEFVKISQEFEAAFSNFRKKLEAVKAEREAKIEAERKKLEAEKEKLKTAVSANTNTATSTPLSTPKPT